MTESTRKDIGAECFIRHEATNDHEDIRQIHRLAFNGPAEGKFVDDLREGWDVVFYLSLAVFILNRGLRSYTCGNTMQR